jgi:hypothetical protein
VILKIQYVQGREKITALKGRDIFANITEEGVELRTVSTEHLGSEERYEEILKQSSVMDFVEFEDIVKVDKKIHGEKRHCIIGIFGSKSDIDQGRPWIVIRLASEAIMDECYE